MKRAKIVVGSIVIVLVGAGVAFYMLGGMDKVRAAFQPKNQQKTISVEGKILCLPTNGNSDTSALSCAIGMETSDGTYYGLSSSPGNSQLSEAAGTDKEVKISGDLQPATNDTYKMEGVIAVHDFHFVGE